MLLCIGLFHIARFWGSSTCVYQFIPFYCLLAFNYIDIPNFFIHSFVDGRLVCFHFLAIMKNAIIIVHKFVWMYAFIFLGIYLGVQSWPGLYGNFMFNILRNCHTVFQRGHTSLYSYQHCTRVPIYPWPLNMLSSVFLVIAIIGYEIVSHSGFTLHFHDNKGCWAHFHVLIRHSYISFGKLSIQILWPIKKNSFYFDCGKKKYNIKFILIVFNCTVH